MTPVPTVASLSLFNLLVTSLLLSKLASSMLNLPVTFLLRAMWHIRPQNNPANHLCQPMPFVPHSSSSIPLFPFLRRPPCCPWSSPISPPLWGPGYCSPAVILYFFPHDVTNEFPVWFSISVIFRTSLFVILSCQRILNIRLRHLYWKTSIFFSSHLFIFHVSQPCIKTWLTSVLYSLTGFGSSTDAVAAQDLFQSQEYPSRFDYSVMDVFSTSTLFGNCSS